MSCKDCGKRESIHRFISTCERCGCHVCADCAYDANEYDRESWVCGPCLHPAAYRTEPFPERHPQLKSLSEAQSEREVV